jgi:hypothetical protein
VKVTFLVPDLGWPIVGIAARFAKYVCREHEVEIVGPRLWGGANAMYSEEFEYRAVDCPKIYRLPEYFGEVRKLARALQGDVIVSLKAFGANLPAALLAKREHGCRVVAYLDEWDGATSASWSWRERLGHWRRDWMHRATTLRALGRAPPAGMRRAAGHHAFPRTQIRLPGFPRGRGYRAFQAPRSGGGRGAQAGTGVARSEAVGVRRRGAPAQGARNYAAALAHLGQPHAAILILGPMDDYVRELMRHPEYGKHVLCPATDADAARRIHRDMPLHLGLGDALIVPLSDGPMARSQMPCKVFEAMAMGKPIVASAVSDLPEVLAGCGKLVEPGRPEAVAQAVDEIFDDPAGARVMGERARARCLEKFGAESSRQALLALLDELK